MKSQPANATVIRQGSILGTLLILMTLGMLTRSAGAETKQIDVTPSFHPQTAETRQVEFTLKADSYQTFPALIQQAELLAKGFIEQGFAQIPSPQRISVKISAERDGQETPLLFSEVSRSDWQRQPNIQSWSKNFSTSAVLLGFSKRPLSQSTPTEVANTSSQRATSSGTEDTSNQVPVSPGATNTSNQAPASPGTADTSNQPSAAPGSEDTSNQPSAPPRGANTSRPIKGTHDPAGFR